MPSTKHSRGGWGDGEGGSLQPHKRDSANKQAAGELTTHSRQENTQGNVFQAKEKRARLENQEKMGWCKGKLWSNQRHRGTPGEGRGAESRKRGRVRWYPHMARRGQRGARTRGGWASAAGEPAAPGCHRPAVRTTGQRRGQSPSTPRWAPRPTHASASTISREPWAPVPTVPTCPKSSHGLHRGMIWAQVRLHRLCSATDEDTTPVKTGERN